MEGPFALFAASRRLRVPRALNELVPFVNVKRTKWYSSAGMAEERQ